MKLQYLYSANGNENQPIKEVSRVCNQKLFYVFLNLNICCGYSKEMTTWDGSIEHPKHMLKIRKYLQFYAEEKCIDLCIKSICRYSSKHGQTVCSVIESVIELTWQNISFLWNGKCVSSKCIGMMIVCNTGKVAINIVSLKQWMIKKNLKVERTSKFREFMSPAIIVHLKMTKFKLQKKWQKIISG